MNLGAIDQLKSRGTNVIITVDNGISAIEEIAYAKALGIDVVVTDHHRVGEVLPDAVAVVDPHREDSVCEFSDWAGVGVAFKLVSALDESDYTEESWKQVSDAEDALKALLADDGTLEKTEHRALRQRIGELFELNAEALN